MTFIQAVLSSAWPQYHVPLDAKMDHKATVKIQNAPLGMHSWGSLWLLEIQKYLSLFKFLSFFISVHFQKKALKYSGIKNLFNLEILPGFRPRHGRIKSPSIEVVRTWAQRQDQDEDRKEDMHHQQHIKGWHLPWMFSRPWISQEGADHFYPWDFQISNS